MTEPFLEHGVWCFWLAADEPVLHFVGNLHCVLNVSYAGGPFGRPQGRILVRINPRYDHEEVWLWLQEVVEIETRRVELSDSWEDLLDSIIHDSMPDDNLF